LILPLCRVGDQKTDSACLDSEFEQIFLQQLASNDQQLKEQRNNNVSVGAMKPSNSGHSEICRNGEIQAKTEGSTTGPKRSRFAQESK